MEAQVLGLSVDSVPCLKAWGESLGGINFPLLSDFYPHGRVARIYSVFRSDGTSERALFVIDKQGVIRYIDVHDIDSQPDNEVLFNELAQIAPGSAGALRRAAPPEPSAEPDANVVMYCTPWCPACLRARNYFKQNNVPFVEIDITRDRAAAQRVRNWAKGFETTPTFKINGEVVVEFNKDAVDKALNLRKS
jgi:glutaredoxin